MPPRYPWGRDDFREMLFQDLDMAYGVQSGMLRENARQLSYEPERRTLSVPITHLSHCTHNKQASQIKDNDENEETMQTGDYTGNNLCFKAYRKDPRENTHVYNIDERTTEQLFDHHSVLPGYLSWWGVSTIEWYNSDKSADRRRNETRDIVSRLAQRDCATMETIYVPPYLQYWNGKACSVYGGNSFSCPIGLLIESYQQSRNSCCNEDNPIYFKKAGTLRYRHEICYVILVCTKNDLRNKDISSMPGAGQPDTNMGRNVTYFNHGEFIAPDGELKLMEITPEFITEYPIRAIYTGPGSGRFYSWDTLNFAFYFPKRQGQLRVHPGYIAHAYTKHDSISCHLGSCPDNPL